MIYHGSRNRFKKFDIRAGGGESITGRNTGIFFTSTKKSAQYHVKYVLREQWGIGYECEDPSWILDAANLDFNKIVADSFHKKASRINSLKMQLIEFCCGEKLPWHFYGFCIDKCPIYLLARSFWKEVNFSIHSEDFATNSRRLELDAIKNPHVKVRIDHGKFMLEEYNMNGYDGEILILNPNIIIIKRRYVIR